MKYLIKRIFKSKLLLKAIAILYAYLLWIIISQTLFSSLRVPVPVILYDTPENLTIQSPKSIDIYLKGKRRDLKSFISQNPSITINANAFQSPGSHSYAILEEHIFLPEEIKLIDYRPSNLNILVTQK